METTTSVVETALPAPAGKSIFTKWWFWLIVLVFILICIFFYRYKNRQATPKVTQEEMELAARQQKLKTQLKKCVDDSGLKDPITEKHPCYGLKQEFDKASAALANKIP